MLERLLTESRVVAWYISLLLLPLPSRLSMEHDVVISTSLLAPPSTLLSCLFLLLSAFLILRFRRKWPLVTYGGAWFFLNLAIESTIVPLELVFEHRLYLPSVGFWLSFVVVLASLAGHARRQLSQTDFVKISWSIFAILISGLTLMTFQRNEAWQDAVSINRDAVSKAPNHHRSHANYAVALLRTGRFEEAVKEAEISIRLGQPHFESYMVASNTIVGALAGLGKLEEATERAEELLAAAPKTFDAGAFPVFCLQTAETYRRLGRFSQAHQTSMKSLRFDRMSAYQMMLLEEQVARIVSEAKDQDVDLNNDGVDDPGELPVRTWVAQQFLRVGKRTAAVKVLEQELLENPDHDQTLRTLQALQLEDSRNREQAAKGDFINDYLRRPFSRFNMTIALAYLVRKHNMPAPFSLVGLAWINEAVAMRPNIPEAHLLRAWYYYWMGQIGQALTSANEALELDPEYAKAWLARGFFLAGSNAGEQALSALNKCLELYPGNPQRKNIIALITELRTGALADYSNVGYEFRKN
jgi:tetratricopeptide (TPR) repeat protein